MPLPPSRQPKPVVELPPRCKFCGALACRCCADCGYEDGHNAVCPSAPGKMLLTPPPKPIPCCICRGTGRSITNRACGVCAGTGRQK